MIRLLLKIHNVTHLKYLCMTSQEDYKRYPGSGTYWREHLGKHGYDVTTILLYETESKEEFTKISSAVSDKLNIVERKDFANLRPETGQGGDTVSNKIWITNGTKEMYILKTSVIPDGFYTGRSDRCVFKNKELQSLLSSRIDRSSERYIKTRKTAAEKMMAVRNHSKCGRTGDGNPAKRQEVKDKIRKARSKNITLNGVSYDSIKEATILLNTTRHEISKLLRKQNDTCSPL
jgi:hypothetical protein